MKNSFKMARHVCCVVLSIFAFQIRAQDASALAKQISHSPAFGPHIVWVGTTPPAIEDSQAAWAALETWRTNGFEVGLSAVEAFLEKHPASPWAASLHANMGKVYRERGRYTLALQHWEQAWHLAKEYTSGDGKLVADFTLAYWTRLLSSLGRIETLNDLVQQAGNRRLVHGALQQMFNNGKESLAIMTVHPGISFKCGTLALLHVGREMKSQFNPKLLMDLPSPTNGFTMTQLKALSDAYQLDLVPVQRPKGGPVIVPSVIHFRQNHYAAIVQFNGDKYQLLDPTFGTDPYWMSLKDIEEESSGHFMVPGKLRPPAWPLLSQSETDLVFGKGYPNDSHSEADVPCYEPEDDEYIGQESSVNPGANCGCGQDPTGLARWRVSEPHINLWMDDIPFAYQPSVGPKIKLKMHFKQRDTREWGSWFDFGGSWESSWFSFLHVTDLSDGTNGNLHDYKVIRFAPRGGEFKYYYTNGTPELYSHTTISSMIDYSSGSPTGFVVAFQGGAQHTYGYYFTNWYHEGWYFMTDRKDKHGNITRFNYETNVDGNVRLVSVIDPDGHQNNVYYDGDSGLTVQQITDPWGRSVTFTNTGDESSITDMIGVTSSFVYDVGGYISSLTTPYGTTTFAATGSGLYMGGTNFNRTVHISNPDGTQELYGYRDNAAQVDTLDARPLLSYSIADADGGVSEGASRIGTFEVGYAQLRDTFYWNPIQYASLSTTNLTAFYTNDYNKARMRHWLHEPNATPSQVVRVLSYERQPSLDGLKPGSITWLDYSGKNSDPIVRGDEIYPLEEMTVLPDGKTNEVFRTLDGSGRISTEMETFTGAGGAIEYRTNTFTYSSYLFPDQIKGPSGETLYSFSYDGSNRVTAITDPAGDTVNYLYDADGRLIRTKFPTGLTRTNIYGGDGRLATQIDLEFNRTNTFTWSADLLTSKTDERGTTINYLRDAFGRILSEAYPDGSTVSNVYTALSLTATKDRSGNWTYFAYDSMQRPQYVTNALGHPTYFSYCACGALGTITDGMGNSTYIDYDGLKRQSQITLPDGYYIANTYDRAGRLIRRTDSAGNSVTNTYNVQGLLVASTNAFGRLLTVKWDNHDRPTNFVTAEGVSINQTFDNAGRLRTRTYPDGGQERYGYTNGLLKVYTNQLGETTWYVYDAAGRLRYQTNANNEAIELKYDASGNLTNLVDGNQHNTFWKYDEYSRVTNKLDHSGASVFKYVYQPNGWMTNRVTPAKGTNTYKYDAAGNLTNIVYPATAPVTFAYDAAERITGVANGAGTTSFSYYYDLLSAEDGPWDGDTVSFSYNNRLRSALAIGQPNASPWTQTYAYDGGRRLTGITSPAGTFSYQYTNSPSSLIKKLLFPNAAYVTNTFDSVGRLAGTFLKNSGNSTVDSFQYDHNTGGRRTAVTALAGNYINYGYDNIGQLTSAQGFESGGGYRVFEWNTYAYDRAGNLTNRITHNLGNSFAVDPMNELTNSTRGGTLTVVGTTTGPATNVLVNSTGATIFSDNTFAAAGFSPTNGWNTYTAIALDNYGRSDTNAINVYLPSSVTFAYDANGNLLSDGQRYFNYDDENQLTEVIVTNVTKSNFVYDGLGRRRIRTEAAWTGAAWATNATVRYVYDRNLVVQERDGNNVPLATYARGLDLSGTMQDAGGIGGLLARTDNATGRSAYYHSDELGNITSMTDSSQSIVAKYLYDPFGNTVSASGPLAESNPYRYSSKEFHANSGTYYYLYRYYDPSLQRWLNRDPIEEEGGINLYADVENNPLNLIDPYGLHWTDYIPDFVTSPRVVDFAAGMADNLTFGLTDKARNALDINDSVNKCTGAYSAGEWAGTALTVATGVAGGIKAAGVKGAGKEFSHWIPNRMGGPRSIWNGNYVSPARHYLHDPFRYPPGWKQLGDKLNPILQQLDRIPNAITGTAAGTGYGVGSQAANSRKKCGCP